MRESDARSSGLNGSVWWEWGFGVLVYWGVPWVVLGAWFILPIKPGQPWTILTLIEVVFVFRMVSAARRLSRLFRGRRVVLATPRCGPIPEQKLQKVLYFLDDIPRLGRCAFRRGSQTLACEMCGSIVCPATASVECALATKRKTKYLLYEQAAQRGMEFDSSKGFICDGDSSDDTVAASRFGRFWVVCVRKPGWGAETIFSQTK